MRPISDILPGRQFGRLTVERIKGSIKGKRTAICSCICGKKDFVVTLSALKAGNTRSCGCMFLEMMRGRFRTHGRSHSVEHIAWLNIKIRCYDKKSMGYENYGGRGITVCDRWKNSFENFFADMGLRPSQKHTLDRINNNGNYEPGNCRWATHAEQSRNRRNNIIITVNGVNMCLTDAARKAKIRYGAAYKEIREGAPREWVLY